MIYSAWLFGFSLLFLAAERVWPEQPRGVVRRGFWDDLVYLIFNGEYLGVLVGAASIHFIGALDRSLELAHLRETFYMGVMKGKPFWLQLTLLLVVFDFAQWCIHNLLHRVPWLWRVHKVHHSIEQMDWIGNWRFHFLEVAFYRTMLYPLAAFFGVSAQAMFWYAVVNTFVGHFAHANLRWRIGPLKYLVNNPEMHSWHHTHPDSGPVNRNFAITLSVWDWIFRTAHAPPEWPKRMGFDGIESYPRHIPGHLVAPFRHGGQG